MVTAKQIQDASLFISNQFDMNQPQMIPEYVMPIVDFFIEIQTNRGQAGKVSDYIVKWKLPIERYPKILDLLEKNHIDYFMRESSWQ